MLDKEQEARLNHLRAQRGDQLIQFQSAESTAKPSEHINLFQLEEQGVSLSICSFPELHFECLVENE